MSDLTEVIKKVKMVFVGGKQAPSGYRKGQVIELPERYLNYPWFKPVPEGADPETGSYIKLETVGEKPPTVKMPPRKKWTPELSTIPGKFKMMFRNEINGAKIKGAPSNFKHGSVHELPLRYANLPWWELMEGYEGIVIPQAGPHDTVYEDQGDGVFVPPEALETDLKEKGSTFPGPYTDAELEAMKKKTHPDFVDADEEERKTDLDVPKHLEIFSQKELPMKFEDVSFGVESMKIPLDEEIDEKIEIVPLPTEAEIKKARKITLVTFIKEHNGAANMRMNLEDLRIAALSILESLKV